MARRRWRWWAKWVCTWAAGLVLLLWLVSGWFGVYWQYEGRGVSFNGSVGYGQVWLFLAAEPRPSNLGVLHGNKLEAFRIPHELHPPRWNWSPHASVWQDRGRRMLNAWLPAWTAITPLGVLAGGLWWLDRRRSRGLCPDCGYDLSATPAGPCPECGRSPSTPVPPAAQQNSI